MSMGHIGRIWLGAIVLAVVSTIGLRVAAGHMQRIDFPASPIVAIGTSLLREAIPPTGEGLLDGQRSFVRLARPRLSGEEALDLLRLAFQNPIQTVVLEVNPFAFDFADVVSRETRPGVIRWASDIIASSWRLNRDLRVAVGLRSADTPLADGSFLARSDPDENMRRLYPLRIRTVGSGSAFEMIVREAQRRGAFILLVAPPRSVKAASYMGERAVRDLMQHLEDIARHYQLPLWAPGPWPDEYFRDQAHLNESGRKRFMDELRAWSDAR